MGLQLDRVMIARLPKIEGDMMFRHSTWIFSVITFFALTTLALVYTPAQAFANQASTDQADESTNAAPAETHQVFIPLMVGNQSDNSKGDNINQNGRVLREDP